MSCEPFDLSIWMLIFISFWVFILSIAITAAGRSFGQGIGFAIGAMISVYKESKEK